MLCYKIYFQCSFTKLGMFNVFTSAPSAEYMLHTANAKKDDVNRAQ